LDDRLLQILAEAVDAVAGSLTDSAMGRRTGPDIPVRLVGMPRFGSNLRASGC